MANKKSLFLASGPVKLSGEMQCKQDGKQAIEKTKQTSLTDLYASY